MVMSRLLKLALAVDAVATATTGLGLAMAGSSLAGVLGFPAALLQITGVILLPYAAVVAYLAARVDVPPAAIWTVIVVNALWAVDTIALLFTGWITPTGLGTAFVIVQSLIVGALAEVQYFALRASARGQIRDRGEAIGRRQVTIGRGH